MSVDRVVNSPTGFAVVGIGASAGGLRALKEFFANVPADSGMAYVVIVHLSEHHESVLAEILQQSAHIPVCQVTETVAVEANKVFVIPPGKHLAMSDGHIQLRDRSKVMGKRVPIDLFFRTLARAYGKDAFAVVMSGAGSDGTVGIERVKEEGGVTAAQEPEDAEYDSMPRSAIGTHLVDVVLPASELPAKLISIRDLAEDSHTEEEIDREKDATTAASSLRDVLTLVRLRTGHDFANYKLPTLMRRVARRLHVNGLTEIADYVKLLRVKPDEVVRLQRDLLITVTNFFRDRDAFDALENKIIAKMFDGKTGQDTVRVWSCGCGTGEEAYSVGILLHEYASTLDDPPKLQIFASDINDDAIKTARDCVYGAAITADVTPERLKRYFHKKGDSFCVNKELRDMVLFAPHNLLRDPPFSQLDLVVCRNLLIYLNRNMQERVMELFNFALRPGGWLFLGASEAAETGDKLFAPVDKRHRIYKSLNNLQRRSPSTLPEIGRWEVKLPDSRIGGYSPQFSFETLHHRIVEEYAPPSVLVNDEHEIVHMSERAGRFLHFTGGEPTRNLLKCVDKALQLDLRAALIAATEDHSMAEFRNIRLMVEGEEKVINLIVRPVELQDTTTHYFLVIFDDEHRSPDAEGTRAIYEAMAGDSALEAVVRRIEDELQRTKDRLRLTIEHSEVSNEELKASNEELQAINEELRSATEELETSKEELQSVNEEMTTVNNELKEKVHEISDMNADLQNLMHSTDIGTIFLDRDLTIKRYTRKVERLFNIISSDIGRPLEHLTHCFEYSGFTTDAREVLETLGTVERELHVKDSASSYLARFLPYRTMDDHIDGVVISLVEITALKRATDSLREREILLGIAQDAAKAGVWALNLRDGSAWWSDECFQLHGLEPGSAEMTRENWISKMHPADADAVRAAIDKAIAGNVKYSYELKVGAEDGYRWILESGHAIYDDSGKPTHLAGISLDVTERVELMRRREADELALREADKRKNEFLATLAHELRNPLAPIRTGLEILRSAEDRELQESTRQAIERQVDQIVHLVDDLLDLSRITQGKIRLKRRRMSLAEAIGVAVDAVQPTMDEQNHRLEVHQPDGPLVLDADFTRVSQILLNLLANASKFTNSGGKISLTARREDDWAVIRVKDNGMGIEPEMLTEVFGIFTQCTPNPDTAAGGLGIGLSLVKKLVELHGGEVQAFSEGHRKGSEFMVSLPLAIGNDPPPEIHEPASSEAGLRTARRVMLVDDNRKAVELLGILLRKHYEIAMAYDGSEALALAETFQPDAVLLDIGLPGKNGREVAAELRSKYPDILLIAISGWGQADDIDLSKRAGFDHHLIKPVQLASILSLLSPPHA